MTLETLIDRVRRLDDPDVTDQLTEALTTVLDRLNSRAGYEVYQRVSGRPWRQRYARDTELAALTAAVDSLTLSPEPA